MAHARSRPPGPQPIPEVSSTAQPIATEPTDTTAPVDITTVTTAPREDERPPVALPGGADAVVGVVDVAGMAPDATRRDPVPQPGTSQGQMTAPPVASAAAQTAGHAPVADSGGPLPNAARDTQPPSQAGLRTDGPTLDEWLQAGYSEATYPPPGYAARETQSYEWQTIYAQIAAAHEPIPAPIHLRATGPTSYTLTTARQDTGLSSFTPGEDVVLRLTTQQVLAILNDAQQLGLRPTGSPRPYGLTLGDETPPDAVVLHGRADAVLDDRSGLGSQEATARARAAVERQQAGKEPAPPVKII